MLIRRIWTGRGRNRARGEWMTARKAGGRKLKVKSQRPGGEDVEVRP